MKLNKDCIIYAGEKRNCAVSQNGKCFRLINEAGYKLTVYNVDPCLINNNWEKKCDYLVVVDKRQECLAYFIELKGTGLSDAISQIMNSIDILISA